MSKRQTVDIPAGCATGSIDIKLASAHLKVLKVARRVEAQRDGRFIAYRLSGKDVSVLWVNLRTVAEEHLVELKVATDAASGFKTYFNWYSPQAGKPQWLSAFLLGFQLARTKT